MLKLLFALGWHSLCGDADRELGESQSNANFGIKKSYLIGVY